MTDTYDLSPAGKEKAPPLHCFYCHQSALPRRTSHPDYKLTEIWSCSKCGVIITVTHHPGGGMGGY